MGTVRQVMAAALPEARIAGIRRLSGGTSAQTHLVRFANHEPVVVREFTAEWHREEPAAASEAHALRRLRHAGLDVPALVWADLDGDLVGHPVVVASRVPGTIRAHPDRADWVGDLAEFLARLHRIRPNATDRRLLYVDPGAQRTWLAEDPPPTHGAVGRLVWPAVQEAFRRYTDPPHRLLHGDFHPANVLNVRGRLSGVVDWEAAMVGPPAYDVAYCCMDITIAHGAEVGDAFVAAYVRASGSVPAELRTFAMVAALRAAPAVTMWIPAWTAQGRAGLTPALVRRRLLAFARHIVAST